MINLKRVVIDKNNAEHTFKGYKYEVDGKTFFTLTLDEKFICVSTRSLEILKMMDDMITSNNWKKVTI